MVDCLTRCAYQRGKACIDSSIHDTQETAEAKRIIEVQCLLNESKIKCFVVMGSSAELPRVQDTKVQAPQAQMRKEDMIRVIEGVQSI